MANLHSRSNSFPSQSNHLLEDVQDQLCRLKSSQSTSTSPISVCASLASLTDPHKGINNLIQMPSAQQALSENGMNELLEESIRLMDLCAFTRDVLCSTKKSVQELESSIRRSRGDTERRSTRWSRNPSRISRASQPEMLILRPLTPSSMKQIKSLDFSILISILALTYGEKERSSNWSFLSKITQTNRVHYEEGQELCLFNIQKSQSSMEMLKQLNSTEMIIQEIEEGLESLFMSLVKTRVSLLNLLGH